jgi:formate-dependent nitrite reductase membrane component NrfD
MQEDLFTSGRNLPNIDPSLHVWHWPISIDLFFGGLAAGLLFIAALFYLIGKEKEMPAAVKIAPIVAPIGIVIALLCLFYDLTHKFYFWRLYMTFRLESPMSFGSWVLLFITPLSFLWVFSFWRELYPNLIFNYRWIVAIENFSIKYRKVIAILLLPLALSLGVYTGILLSAFNARPLWNNAILGPLFLTSGLTTASAVVLFFSRSEMERKLFSKILLGFIGLQLFLFFHMLMGYFSSSEAQLVAAQLLFEGEFTMWFFGGVLFIGLIVPGLIEIAELFGYRISVTIPVLLVLLGGILFRFIMVDAGQVSQFIY